MLKPTKKRWQRIPGAIAKTLLFSLLIVCSIMLSSCSTTAPLGKYTPNPSIAKGIKIDITASAPVAIINAQSTSTEQQLGFREMIVNKHEWTQALIEALAAGLEKNGVTVNENATKQLHVSVTKIDMVLHTATYQGFLDVEITGEGGLKEEFKVDKVSYASVGNVGFNPTKPIDSCFRTVVQKILTNENIQEYLRK